MVSFVFNHMVKEFQTIMDAPVFSFIMLITGAIVAYFLLKLRYRGVIDAHKGTIENLNERVAYWKDKAGFSDGHDNNKHAVTPDSENHKPENGYEWITGTNAMEYYNISHDSLMQYVLNGLPVYPKGRDVLVLGDMVTPMKKEDFAFELVSEDFRPYWFKVEDLRRYLGFNPRPRMGGDQL